MYLGRDSGTIENCIILPTIKILEILKKNKSKALFFIDATFLVVLKRDYHEGYQKVKDQILDILTLGNDVGLHIHPHWIDSYMISNDRWSFKTYDNFRIHNLPKERVSNIIKDSFIELESICKEYSPKYIISSFRAGGWCIQPFSYLKEDLKNIGIKYDFSVLPNMKKENLPKHYYNYEKSPKNKSYWKFDDNILEEIKDGYFVEIPTTVVSMNIFNVLSNKRKIKNNILFGDGIGADDANRSFLSKIKKIQAFIKYSLSSDYMNLETFKYNIKKLNKEFLVFVAHPKNFSSESFIILDFVSKEYEAYNYKKII